MKPPLSIRFGMAILGLVMAGSASACSCKRIGVENLVLDKRLALARIVVAPPTPTEWMVSLFDSLRAVFSGSRTYPVKVLEVITGQYETKAITARASGPGGCGVDLRHGQTYYHLAGPTASGEPLHASVCNLVTEDYARQVKAYKQRPKP